MTCLVVWGTPPLTPPQNHTQTLESGAESEMHLEGRRNLTVVSFSLWRSEEQWKMDIRVVDLEKNKTWVGIKTICDEGPIFPLMYAFK